MLKDTFFTILFSAGAEKGCTYRIALNGLHPIFQAHFAGNPMMPGVCIVQVIKELASEYFGRTFFVYAVKNMKFLLAVNPMETPEISVQMNFTQHDDERISIAAMLYNEEKIYSKSTLWLEYLRDDALYQKYS